MRTVSKVNIPPRTVSIISAKAKCKYSNYPAIRLIERVASLVVKTLMGARCLAPVNHGFTTCQIMNPTQSPISVETGSTIAKISSMASIGTLCSIDPPSKSSAFINSINLKHAKGKSQSELIDVAKELGVSLDNSDLNETRKKDFLAFIGANRDVFAKSIKELGLCNKYKFEIETGDSVPVKKRFYRTSPKAKNEINRQVEEMLDKDIEPCMSPWSSPVVLVPKKTGEYRFATDFRAVDWVTRVMNFPLPRFENVVDTIAASKAVYFTVLDFASNFWQIPVSESSKEKTCFVTESGTYCYKRMPFGVVNAPSVFSMVMSEILRY